MSTRKLISERFEELLAPYLSNALSASEAAEFIKIVNDHPECKRRLYEYKAIDAQSFIPYFEKRRQDNYKALSKRLHIASPKRRVFSSFASRAFVALALIAAIGGGLLYNISKHTTERYASQITTLVVPLGSQLKATLPDQSVVCLNSGSILKYDRNFGRKERKIILEGEGYFEVCRDERRPFIVESNGLGVKVLGTTFNMKNYAEDAEASVSLIEGSVSVYSDMADKSYLISPNESAVLDKNRHTMTVSQVNASKLAQWTNGKLSFVNTPLSNIINDIERAYDVKITIHSVKAVSECFSGSISLSLSIDEVLEYIDVDDKYIWTYIDGKIIMTDK